MPKSWTTINRDKGIGAFMNTVSSHNLWVIRHLRIARNGVTSSKINIFYEASSPSSINRHDCKLNTPFIGSARAVNAGRYHRPLQVANRLFVAAHGSPANYDQAVSEKNQTNVANFIITEPERWRPWFYIGLGAIGCVGLFLLSLAGAGWNLLGGTLFAVGLFTGFFGEAFIRSLAGW